MVPTSCHGSCWQEHWPCGYVPAVPGTCSLCPCCHGLGQGSLGQGHFSSPRGWLRARGRAAAGLLRSGPPCTGAAWELGGGAGRRSSGPSELSEHSVHFQDPEPEPTWAQSGRERSGSSDRDRGPPTAGHVRGQWQGELTQGSSSWRWQGVGVVVVRDKGAADGTPSATPPTISVWGC